VNDHDWATLQQRIRDGRQAITPDGELPLPSRQAILAGIIRAEPDRAMADRLWAGIELECARHAWPIWQSVFPDDNLPLDVAERSYANLLAGRTEELNRELGTLQSHLENAGVTATSTAPVMAGYASWAAAWASWNGPQPTDAASEFDLDVDDWDACFFAATAVAGGAVWEPDVGNPNTRRAFWEWYLDMIEAKISR
jgi:hypothetical protein